MFMQKNSRKDLKNGIEGFDRKSIITSDQQQNYAYVLDVVSIWLEEK